jgi:hypothetical protein
VFSDHLEVFSERGMSNFLFLAKAWSYSKPIIVGENGELNFALLAVYSVFREAAELRNYGKIIVKHSVFAKNAE